MPPSRGRASRVVAAVLATVALLAPLPSRAASVDQSCQTDTSPRAHWVGDHVSQSFRPTAEALERFEVRLHFLRAFASTIEARVILHVPSEDASGDFGVQGVRLAAASRRVEASAGTARWVAFRLAEPVIVPVTPGGAVLEIEMSPGRESPRWGWVQCKGPYRDGRAYGRPDVTVSGAAVPNPLLTMVLPSADLQFRTYR